MNSAFNNLTDTEAKIRMVVATILIAIAVINSNVVFALISLILFHTAYKKYCFVYAIFNINKKTSLKNYYLSFIPQHSPTEVIIFAFSGQVLFKNDVAQKELSNIYQLTDVAPTEWDKLISKDMSVTKRYKNGKNQYNVVFKSIAKEKLILAYFTDISEISSLNKAIETTQSDVIYTMGNIGEFRSKETGNHVKRVALFSEKLALLYGLPKEDAKLLRMASPMHDIGKIAIPDSILNVPRKLTDKEFEIMQTHAELGYEMLKNSDQKIFKAAAIVAHEHHEKYDGTGYPNKLSGKDIHIFGRITAIADVFDALASKRIYKERWNTQEIIDYLHKESKKQFDPELVKIFVSNINSFLKIQAQYAD